MIIKSGSGINIAIIGLGILFLIPKITLFILFSFSVIIYKLVKSPNAISRSKNLNFFFIAYGIVFLVTNGEISILNLIELIKNVGVYWGIVMLIFLFTTNLHDLEKLTRGLLVILFISYIFIGFYQYFTNSILSPWISENDVFVYTASYDLQRFRSFLEMHPSNSAIGILYIVCITIVIYFQEKSITYLLLLTIALVALFLTYTRMSYITAVIIIALYLLKYSGINTNLRIRLFMIFIIGTIIVFLLNYGIEVFSTSTRLSSDLNYVGRLEIWGYFFKNLGDFIWGQGFLNKTTLHYSIRSSVENFYFQQYIHFGFMGIVLYTYIYYMGFRNLQLKSKPLSKYRTTFILMFIAFTFNMMSATYSENMLFLVFGLSFAYRNISIRLININSNL